MTVLLDTHTLLWHYLNDPRLSAPARTTIADPANIVLVSAAGHWEIGIKLSTGKYTLHVPFPTFVQEAVFDNGFALLAIEPRHTTEVIGLPYHHRDPFDRLIIAQAIVEQIAIVGGDPVFDQYGVRRIW